jgi:hypothetical protein
VLAGIGWLYLLRHTGALSVGPRLTDALPLQRLAHGAAQPVLRLAVAWFPAGLVGGFALAALGITKRWVRALALGTVALVALLAIGAFADSVTASDPLHAHLAQQPHRAATWLAAALVAAGAAIPGRRT